MWRETAFFFNSQRAFLLIFILLLHLFADPTVQSDIQLLQFPQTKTCFEWLLQMRSLKIKQLCSNCFSPTHLLFPSCCCFVCPSLWKEKKQTWKRCTLTYALQSSSCHSHGRLMILIERDIVDPCVHRQHRVCAARMNPTRCSSLAH